MTQTLYLKPFQKTQLFIKTEILSNDEDLQQDYGISQETADAIFACFDNQWTCVYGINREWFPILISEAEDCLGVLETDDPKSSGYQKNLYEIQGLVEYLKELNLTFVL